MQLLRWVWHVRSYLAVAFVSFFLGVLVVTQYTSPAPLLRYQSVTSKGSTLGFPMSTQPPLNSISKSLLTTALQHLARAHRYLRNNGRALAELQSTMKLFAGAIEADVPSSEAGEVDVCPEMWKGMTHGWPYYFTGYVRDQNCTSGKPLSSLITVVLNALRRTPSEVEEIIREMQKVYPSITMIVAAGEDMKFSHAPNVTVISAKAADPEGKVWKMLVSNVTTKYAFLARELYTFTNDTKLERMIWTLNRMRATAVGGSHRNETGHWSMGCYQTAMRNYAFRLVEGYDFSSDTCAMCDYLSGPFVAKTDVLVKALDETLSGESLFLDLFSRFRELDETASFFDCPDSMTFMAAVRLSDQSDRQTFSPFARKWQLNKVVLPNEAGVHKYSCSEAHVDCSWSKAGIAMPPCCLDEITYALLALMEVCEAHSIRCEIEGGTVIGAYKFQGQLPWERDFDINWHSRDYWKFLNTTSVFKAKGLSLSENSGKTTMDKMPKCSREPDYVGDIKQGIDCGYFALRTANWRGELWGSIFLAHDVYERREGRSFNVTRTLVAGRWIRTYPNPVNYARNLYGGDVLGHIEHWITLGYGSGWIPYKNSSFLKCPRKGFHGCLDQFFPTGNLQFMDSVWI